MAWNWGSASMYEIDFLPVENQASSKGGDAIALRFFDVALNRYIVVVVDAGYGETGERLADFIKDRYETSRVDLAISTHPDSDHLNGLAAIIEQLSVSELMIHRPRDHGIAVAEYSNIEAIDNLIALAILSGTSVTEPFAGMSRFDGRVQILGPTKEYYERLLAESLAESGAAPSSMSAAAKIGAKVFNLMEKAMTLLPIETLGEDGETSARNNTSVVTTLTLDEKRWLLTGDAGIPALHAALDRYEAVNGPIAARPFDLIQVPHHGSRRNVSPSLLDRLMGRGGMAFNNYIAVVSSAKADPKHPSPKVTNAFARRGAEVYTTEGNSFWHYEGTPTRPGYIRATPLPPLAEDDD